MKFSFLLASAMAVKISKWSHEISEEDRTHGFIEADSAEEEPVKIFLVQQDETVNPLIEEAKA